MRDETPREAVCAAARELYAAGLNEGTAGNVGARSISGFLITPSGFPYQDLEPRHLVELSLDGAVLEGTLKPSSEWRIHRDIFAQRPEVAAVVHTHSPYATALACCRRGIPALHYMIALAGAQVIPCTPYAPFGTQLLSDHVLEGLMGRRACLMANHGMTAVGEELSSAVRLAREVESLARLYLLALQIGGPVVLDAAQMQDAQERFETYGRRGDPAASP